MKSLKEKIEVMQAAADGKKIEIREKRQGCQWTTYNGEPSWNWYDYEYRVKPESRVYYVNNYEGGLGQLHKSLKAAKDNSTPDALETVRLVGDLSFDGVTE